MLVPSDEDVVLKLGEEFVNKPKVLNADAKEFVPKKETEEMIGEEDKICVKQAELQIRPQLSQSSACSIHT